MPRTILIIEDDENIAEYLTLYLEKEGFNVLSEGDGEAGLQAFHKHRPDLVLLDIMLPKMDGWGVLANIRETADTPVIMLTAKGELSDKLTGFSGGADDYIVKPPETKEVIARIHAVLRRYGNAKDEVKRLEYDNLIIDMDAFELTVSGKTVPTPRRELELLFYLASSPNRVFTRDQLLDGVWGYDFYGPSRTIDVHIKRLREKLAGASEQWMLETKWKIGYKFTVFNEKD